MFDDANAADADHDDAVDSLSDVLIAVTDNSTQYNISDKMTEAGFATNQHRELFIFVVFLMLLLVYSIIWP